MTQSAVRAITCPSCGGTVEIRAAGLTVTLVCYYCGSLLDVTNPDVALIEKHERAIAGLRLELGSKGVVRGTDYQVIGYMRRSVDGEGWDEYLLFNPYVGYRWLIDDQGEWSFGTMLTQLPQGISASGGGWRGSANTAADASNADIVRYGDADFVSEGESYEAVVDEVVGEFYWRVATGDRVALTNFEGSGATLSCERQANEINWTRSEPLAPSDLSGFGDDRPDRSTSPGRSTSTAWPLFGRKLPRKTSYTAAPDMPAASTMGNLTWIFLIGVGTSAFLLLATLILSFGGTSTQEFTIPLQSDGAPQTARFGPLTFPNAVQRVALRSSSPSFENAWIDLDMSLVERATQQTVDFSAVVEHYAGSDSDGPWTEGSHTTTTQIAAVPRGMYDLVVEVSAHEWPGGAYASIQNTPVTISISSGGVFFSNLILALVLLAIPPVFLIWMRLRSSGLFGGDD